MKEKNLWYCFDWKSVDWNLYGAWRSDAEYVSLEISLLACGTRYIAYDGTEHGGADNCVYSLEETKQYLGEVLNLMALYNHGTF